MLPVVLVASASAQAQSTTDWCDQIKQFMGVGLPDSVIIETITESEHVFLQDEITCISALAPSETLLSAVVDNRESLEQTAQREAQAQAVWLRSNSIEAVQERYKLISQAATQSKTEAWEISVELSPMDDTTTVVLSVDADEIVKGFLDATRPALVVRCKERQLETYVVTGLSAHVEHGNLDGSTVRIRLDREPPQTLNTGQSTSNSSLFFPNPGTLLTEMKGHDKMLFEFIPYNASPQITSFPITGLSELLVPVSMACSVPGYDQPVQ